MKKMTSISLMALFMTAFSTASMAAEKNPMDQQISCQLMKVVAENIINQRQNGVVVQAVENRLFEVGAEFPGSRQMTKGFVAQAYQTPIALEQAQKQQVIDQFRENAYQQCVCQYHSDTI